MSKTQLTDGKVTEIANGIVEEARRQIADVSCSCRWPETGKCAKAEFGVESAETPCKMEMVRGTMADAQQGARA